LTDKLVLAMQTASASPVPMDRAELPGMLATLCSYESCFGPYHPQTLCLMTQVAVAYWQAGEPEQARPLLEKAVNDLRRHLGRNQDLRLRAIATLRDLYMAQRDYERAGVAQRELLECQIQRLGSENSETVASRADLGTILLEKIGPS
jgi:hypothetical protein